MASIDVEDENILTTIFKDSFPESWQENPDFLQYLVELSSYGVEKLAREPDRLAEESGQVLEETQDLAFHNYTTFIQTADCSKEIFQDFQIIEKHLDNVLEKLPPFAEECNSVVKKAQEISSSRQMNTLTLQRHTQLLEILEMPQLMDTCVRNGYYEEALELAAHVKRLEKKLAHIPVIMGIVNDIKNSTQLMLNELIQQLRTNIQLPACLRVIGYLRQMDVFTEAELRIKFLQARDSWFQNILNAIPQNDAYVHITKTIEASRVHLFDIITQYRAIFSDEDPLLSVSHDDAINETALFHGWVVRKFYQFLNTLESDLRRGVGGRLDSLLGQCMYFGLSFSRVGADFRALVAPVFQRAALTYFEAALSEANKNFEENMKSYNLLGVTGTSGAAAAFGSISQTGQIYPPSVLLDFYPLAAYCNHVLSAFNELRLCAPVNLACFVAGALERSLLEVNRVILAFFRAEETTFNDQEKDQFGQFCATYVTDLLPYMNKCLQVLFPPSMLAASLGITVSEMSKMGVVGMVDLKVVIGQVEHLIPRIEEVPCPVSTTPAASSPSTTATPTSPITTTAATLPPPSFTTTAETVTTDASIPSSGQTEVSVSKQSETLAQQTGQSETITHHISQSETLSHQTGQSETLTHQTGQSETITHQTDQSETLTHQTGQSETLSHQTGQSETLTHQTGQSETLTHHTSQSETLTHQTDQSETLPHQTGQSDSVIQEVNEATLQSEPLEQEPKAESGQSETTEDNKSEQGESDVIDLDNLPFEMNTAPASEGVYIDTGLAESLAANISLSMPSHETKQD